MEKVKQKLNTTYDNIHQMMTTVNKTLLEIDRNRTYNIQVNYAQTVPHAFTASRARTAPSDDESDSVIIESEASESIQPAIAFFVQRTSTYSKANSFIPYTKVTPNSNKLYSFDLKSGIFRPKIPGVYYVYFSGIITSFCQINIIN